MVTKILLKIKSPIKNERTTICGSTKMENNRDLDVSGENTTFVNPKNYSFFLVYQILNAY